MSEAEVAPIVQYELRRVGSPDGDYFKREFPFAEINERVATGEEEQEGSPLFIRKSVDMNMTMPELDESVHRIVARRAKELVNFLRAEVMEKCEKREELQYRVVIYMVKQRANVHFKAEVYEHSLA